MRFRIGENDALIIVDVQKDFCPGGTLPVPKGDHIVPVLNHYIELFQKSKAHIFVTRDWHPSNHSSFKSYGGKWPQHCIRGSKGAEFHPNLNLPETANIISKASYASKEAYSGFNETKLEEELKKRGVRRIFVGGLATEYCVKNTILDALKLGFETVILSDAIVSLNIDPDDSKRAVEEMLRKGVKEASLSDIRSTENLEGKNSLEVVEKEQLRKAEERKKARLRTRGPYRKASQRTRLNKSS